MAISTYTELQDAIASWLHRSNLTTTIPDLITLAEDELNAELRLRVMEVDETLTLTAGDNTVALPARYLEPVLLEIVWGGTQENERLTFLSPMQMTLQDSANVAVEPEYWTVNGENIEFPEPADQNYTLRFRMLKRLDIATDTTNYLLSNWRGLYLYGALLQSAPFIHDDARMQTWGVMYEKLMRKVKNKESRSKALATLRTDSPLLKSRSNIYRG
jgi:hypothetical protein